MQWMAASWNWFVSPTVSIWFPGLAACKLAMAAAQELYHHQMASGSTGGTVPQPAPPQHPMDLDIDTIQHAILFDPTKNLEDDSFCNLVTAYAHRHHASGIALPWTMISIANLSSCGWLYGINQAWYSVIVEHSPAYLPQCVCGMECSYDAHGICKHLRLLGYRWHEYWMRCLWSTCGILGWNMSCRDRFSCACLL